MIIYVTWQVDIYISTKFRRHVTILAKVISIYLKYNIASAAILDCNTAC